VKSPGRIQTVILFAALLGCPVVSAAVITAVTLGLLQGLGVAHAVAISAGVGAAALLANMAALGLAFAKSDGDDRARELLTKVEEPAAEAQAS
jgi:hypothetical protein